MIRGPKVTRPSLLYRAYMGAPKTSPNPGAMLYRGGSFSLAMLAFVDNPVRVVEIGQGYITREQDGVRQVIMRIDLDHEVLARGTT